MRYDCRHSKGQGRQEAYHFKGGFVRCFNTDEDLGRA